MSFMFENLGIYQKAVDFADKIMALTEQFPRGYYFLTDQLCRRRGYPDGDILRLTE